MDFIETVRAIFGECDRHTTMQIDSLASRLENPYLAREILKAPEAFLKTIKCAESTVREGRHSLRLWDWVQGTLSRRLTLQPEYQGLISALGESGFIPGVAAEILVTLMTTYEIDILSEDVIKVIRIVLPGHQRDQWNTSAWWVALILGGLAVWRAQNPTKD